MTTAAPAALSRWKNTVVTGPCVTRACVTKACLPVVMSVVACIVIASVASFAMSGPALARDAVSAGNTAPAPAAAPADPAAAKSGGYPAVPLLETGKTILGEKIRYPRTGDANVTAAIFTLEPGGRSMLHKHGVPLFAYILEGELTVDYGKHGTRVYKQGQSLMEAMNVAHFSVNSGAVPVRLLAVYMGAKNARDVVPVK